MDDSTTSKHEQDGGSGGGGGMSYWRFGAMIATSVVVMYAIKYLSTYTWDHVHLSEMRAYMSLMMGAAMGVIMLGFMLGMYTNRRINIGIFVGSAVLFGVAFWLMRSQETVQDESYMRSMIPHHSIAILTSERSELSDVRVCRLAEEIIVAQRKEIKEMEWLLEDIDDNGPVESEEAANDRPVPKFEGSETRPGC